MHAVPIIGYQQARETGHEEREGEGGEGRQGGETGHVDDLAEVHEARQVQVQTRLPLLPLGGGALRLDVHDDVRPLEQRLHALELLHVLICVAWRGEHVYCVCVCVVCAKHAVWSAVGTQVAKLQPHLVFSNVTANCGTVVFHCKLCVV